MIRAKYCTKCRETKEIALFGVERRSKDGYTRRCKVCINDYYSEYGQKQKSRAREKARYARRYSEDPGWKGRYLREWRSKWTSEQWKAHYAATNAHRKLRMQADPQYDLQIKMYQHLMALWYQEENKLQHLLYGQLKHYFDRDRDARVRV